MGKIRFKLISLGYKISSFAFRIIDKFSLSGKADSRETIKEHKINYFISTKYTNLFLIAFKMLVHSKKKFIGMVVGATFSAFIIMQQPSVYQGVTDRITSPISAITDIDLWVMAETSHGFERPTYFKPIDIYRVRSVPGVLWAKQLYRMWYPMQHLATKKKLTWELVGVDPKTLLGLPKTMIQGQRLAIKQANAILVDGYALKQLESADKQTIKLADKMIERRNAWKVVGITQPLQTYMIEPKLYMTSNHIPNILQVPSFILVKIKPSYDIKKIAEMIYKRTGFIALTPTQFIDRSNKFFEKQTPVLIGFIGIAIVGFSIGLVMMWQIFSNFVLTHLHQFGMLKMLGVSSSLLIKMVLFQTVLTGGLGYIIGLLLNILFGLIFHDTVVAFHLTWNIVVLGALGTLVVITFSSYFSILKVLQLDTVELCRDSN